MGKIDCVRCILRNYGDRLESPVYYSTEEIDWDDLYFLIDKEA